MKKISAILLVVLISAGCVNNTAYLKLPYPSTADTLKLVDQRPKGQQTSGLMSLNIANCSYGSYQFGDEHQIPNRMEMLRNYMAHYFEEKPPLPKEVIVKNFTIHLNDAAGLRSSVAGSAGGGALGAIITDAIVDKKTVGCSFDDLSGGFSLDEKRDQYPPIITVIDVEIDGKTYHARTTRSLAYAYWGRRNPDWDQLIQDAITETSRSLVEKIDSNNYVVIPK